MNSSRRNFIKISSALTGGLLLGLSNACKSNSLTDTVPVYGHVWVYASRFPPDWDCTPILDTVFSDLKRAGLQGVELMESILRHDDAVSRLTELKEKYNLPVIGSSYYGDMWNKQQQQHIIEDIQSIIEKLHAVGATMIGLTVGDAGHKKTEDELDVQADTVKKIMAICNQNNIQPNLHNHTFEVVNNLYDLKETLKRIPDAKLGPDLNWLIRGGVNPVWFIKKYHERIVFMHIRDQDEKGKWTEAVGEGVTDFPAIAKALQDVNYDGKAAIELAFDKPNLRPVEEDWMLSRQYVRKVFDW